MGRGRPKDIAPEGYYTTSEAAAVLGVTPARVRQRIADGTLPTAPDTLIENAEGEFAEHRHYVPKDVVDAEAERKRKSPALGEVEEAMQAGVDRGVAEVVSQVEEMFGRVFGESDERLLSGLRKMVKDQQAHYDVYFREVLKAIGEQRAEVTGKLEELTRAVEDSTRAAREAAASERRYQERVIEIFQRLEEQERARAESGRAERRSWLRRLFGN